MASSSTIVVRVDETDDPNETTITILEIQKETMRMKAYAGFYADDILKLLRGGENE